MDLRTIVADRLGRLQALNMAALQSVPPHTTEVLAPKVEVTQYHETLTSGGHKVVVQAIRPKWLGLSTSIEVDGFVVALDGTKRAHTEEEKWPYL